MHAVNILVSVSHDKTLKHNVFHGENIMF